MAICSLHNKGRGYFVWLRTEYFKDMEVVYNIEYIHRKQMGHCPFELNIKHIATGK